MNKTALARQGGTLPVAGTPAEEIDFISIHPVNTVSMFRKACELIRRIAREPEAGQNVALLSDQLVDDPTARLTLAVTGAEQVVGCLVSTLESGRSHVLYGGLGIDSSCRRLGLSTRLVKHAIEDRVRQDGGSLAGFAYVRIRQQLNHGSFKAFHKNGFQPCKRVRTDRDLSFGPLAAHWVDAHPNFLLIARSAEPKPSLEFDQPGSRIELIPSALVAAGKSHPAYPVNAALRETGA